MKKHIYISSSKELMTAQLLPIEMDDLYMQCA